MSKTKKLTFNMIAAAANVESAMVSIEVPGVPGLTFEVKPMLSLKDSIGFVSDVVDSCVDMETGQYTPEVFDFAVRVNILSRYAGVDAPKDLNKAYKVVYETKVVETIMSAINSEQFALLVDSAKAKMEHMASFLITSTTSKVNELVSKMDDVMKTNADVVGNINSESFKDLLASMTKLTEERDEDSGVTTIPFTKE